MDKPIYNYVNNLISEASGNKGIVPYRNNYGNNSKIIQQVSPIDIRGKIITTKSSLKLPTIPVIPLGDKVKSESFFDKNKSDIRSLVGLGTSYMGANKLQDNIKTDVIQNTPYVYTNRSSTLTNGNQANFRNFLNNRTGTPINSTQAFAKTLEADNKINAMEGERQEASLNDYNNKNMQVNAANVQMLNRNAAINAQLYNQKVGAKADAFSVYLQNLDARDLEKSMMLRDTKAMQYLGLGLENGRADGMIQALLQNLLKTSTPITK